MERQGNEHTQSTLNMMLIMVPEWMKWWPKVVWARATTTTKYMNYMQKWWLFGSQWWPLFGGSTVYICIYLMEGRCRRTTSRAWILSNGISICSPLRTLSSCSRSTLATAFILTCTVSYVTLSHHVRRMHEKLNEVTRQRQIK